MSRNAPRLAYQPALDGLRAVAVLAVILYHNGISWLPGGFLGVDIFFALSGYLITTLLLMEWTDPGGIDLRSFWVRRIRRLLPALLLVLVGVSLYAELYAPAITLHSIRWDAIASLFYWANWRFVFSHQSYFEQFAAPSPLRHLWSLAVEEQWYLFWPIFLSLALTATKRSVAPLLAVLTTMAAASIAWMWWLTAGSGDPSRAYYGTDTRAHTLLLGAILAIVLHRWPIRTRRARNVVQVLGMIGSLAVVAFLVFVGENDRWMYHGGFALLAVATCAVLAALMLPVDNPTKRFLRLRPMVAIGTISYGLYLWHWPINVWLTPARVGLDHVITVGPFEVQSFLLFLLRTSVTVFAAIASYQLVELPIRHGALKKAGQRMHPPRPVPALATLVAVVATIGLVLVSTAGAPTSVVAASGLPPGISGSQVTAPRRPSTPITTLVPVQKVRAEAHLPAVPPDRKVQVMVAGDSAAWTLAWAQTDAVPGAFVSDRALIGCGVMDTQYFVHATLRSVQSNCPGWQDYWQEGSANQKPDVTVLMAGAWEVYDHEVDGKRVGPLKGSAAYEKAIRASYENAIDRVLAASPTTKLLFVLPGCMHEHDDQLGGPTSERNDPARLRWVNDVVRRIAKDYGTRAQVTDMGDLVCPGGVFRKDIDGVELRPDGVHFSTDSAALIWRDLGPKVLAFARTPT